jgi:hypothetical protein
MISNNWKRTVLLPWSRLSFHGLHGRTGAIAITFIWLFLVKPAFADSSGTWFDATGATIPAPTVSYTINNYFDETPSLSLDSINFATDVGTLELPVGINPLVSSSASNPVNWSSPLIWNNVLIPWNFLANLIDHAQGGTIASTSSQSSGITLNAVDFSNITSAGPTNGEFNILVVPPDTIPFLPFVSLSLGTEIVYDVDIGGQQFVNLDQNVTLRSLTVEAGSTLNTEAGQSLSLQVDLINSGTMTLAGSLNGTTVNAGTFAWTGGGISGSGGFNNQGNLAWSGGTLTNTLVNQGNLNWSGGTVNGILINSGAMTVSGTGTMAIDNVGVLTNHGTITQTGTAQVQFNSSNFTYPQLTGILNNAPDGTYNLTGDGGLQSGTLYTSSGSYPFGSGVINNSGLFEKTGGTGTSIIAPSIAFNNTGTVEVDSGTMAFNGGGSITTGNYVFNNGSVVQLAGGSETLSGAINISGNGTLQINGAVVSAGGGNSSTFTNLNNGANLLISGGAVYGDTNSSVTFNLTGNSQTTFSGGLLGGPGSTINMGNFIWTGGTISDYNGFGSITGFTNNASMTISGPDAKSIDTTGVLTNHGTITQTGTAQVLFNNYSNYPTVQQGVLTNAVDGTYNLTGDGGLSAGTNANNFSTSGVGSGFGVVNNAGLFEKTGGTETSTIASTIAFNNTGTVEVDSGTLAFQGGGSITSGNYVFSNGNVAQLAGGSESLNGSINLSGNGTLQINGAVVSVSGSHSATFTNLTDRANLLINGGTVYGDTNSSVTFNLTGNSQTTFAGGLLGGPGSIINTGNFIWTGGTISDYNGFAPTTGFTNNGSMTISGTGTMAIDNVGVLTNHGTITQTGTAQVQFNASSFLTFQSGLLNNSIDGTYNLTGDGGLASGFYTNSGGSFNGIGSGTVNNVGLFEKTGGTGISTIASTIALNNTGTVEVDSGTLSFQGSVTQQSGNTLTGGTWNVNANSTLSLANGGDITTNQGNVTLSGANSSFTNFNSIANNQGSFNLSNGRSFSTIGNLTNSGQVNIDKTSSLNVDGTFIQTATGTLAGEGTLAGDTNLSGNIEAGNAGLTINGNLALNSDAALKFDLGSINVQGNLALNNANLILNFALGNNPLASGTQLTLLTYSGTESGVFDFNGSAVVNGSLIQFGVNTFQVDYAFGDPSVMLISKTIPEPSTYAMFGIGLILLAVTSHSRVKRTLSAG